MRIASGPNLIRIAPFATRGKFPLLRAIQPDAQLRPGEFAMFTVMADRWLMTCQTQQESGPPSRISLTEEGEVAYWMKNLELTELRLREIISIHGSSVEAVMTAAGK